MKRAGAHGSSRLTRFEDLPTIDPVTGAALSRFAFVTLITQGKCSSGGTDGTYKYLAGAAALVSAPQQSVVSVWFFSCNRRRFLLCSFKVESLRQSATKHRVIVALTTNVQQPAALATYFGVLGKVKESPCILALGDASFVTVCWWLLSD
jgi:hypothetical protein